MTPSVPNRRRERGFTLVEIMVVVVIIGLLATLVVPAVMGRLAQGEESKAQADLTAIYSAAQNYALVNKRIPEIEELTEPDSNGHPWIEGGQVPVDPWNNPYEIRRLEGRLRFCVVSWGPDAMPDTEDDMIYPVQKES